MKTVGVRELKNRLSEYLRRVRAGEGVLVTDRGEIIAETWPTGAWIIGLVAAGGAPRARETRAAHGWRAAGPERLRRAPPFTQAQTIGVPASRRGARPAVNLYAESSAILAWLLGEEEGTRVRRMLADAEIVVASDLTVIECDRVLLRGTALGELTEADAADRRAYLTTAVSHWHVMRIGPEIVDRARQPFPGEPIRTLDAIHLASALFARTVVAKLGLLTLDDRIRRVARHLGLQVFP